MDTVGTFSVAKEMSKNNLFTTVAKQFTVQDWIDFAKENPEHLPNVAVSSGITETDTINLKNIMDAVPDIGCICLDVANGYTQYFVDYVQKNPYYLSR